MIALRSVGCVFMFAAFAMTLTACSAPSASPASSPAVADCTNISPADVVRAVGDLGSYRFEAEGTTTRYERRNELRTDIGPGDEPETVVEERMRFSGAYGAPDRLTELWDVGDVAPAEEKLVIGYSSWIRDLGSLRWKKLADSDTNRANVLLLALTGPVADWAVSAAQAMPGACVMTRTAASSGEGKLTVTLTLVPGSLIPVTMKGDRENDPALKWWGGPVSTILTYHIQAGGEVKIDEPTVDPGPATAEELSYAIRQRGCSEPPCDVSGLRVVYETHTPGVDLFGYELSGRNGSLWFDDGRPTDLVSGCQSQTENGPTPSFTWSEHWSPPSEAPGGEPATTVWIGGHFSLANSASLHVRYSDGVEEEHAITAPAYIVRARWASGMELEIVQLALIGADGTELLRLDVPVTPPSPPAC